ncbi:aspartate-trna ligase [Plasmopara halstedii]|uniref:Aspartate-trna ligase n=1 Tax=Plasmopara halstedii TaxID=4781 RepID=A0A0P1AS06_PLAHL|nr:aspartate-trna ligase [Plasmopara halstedii]CEG44518.1 aspartate-trna ligase [Plasmopara halstedii]|eukprot:XP_024580887.1 aspartate-trna ligase [Plasmopara halstedii]
MLFTRLRQGLTRIQSARFFSSFRTHSCGELRQKSHEGHRVTLSGWVDSIRPFGPICFLSLRDRYGITQLVLESNFLAVASDVIYKIRPESVIQATGIVRARPVNMHNPKIATGAIEVVVDKLVELNACVNLPLQVATGSDIANEDTRLRHRYLDLRRSALQQNLVIRSKISLATRNFLCSEGFLEIETPTLFKSTPEGAREFLVPTRTAGQFYALTQSPQQYKQLLMVGGLDRYFQLARCYRDEGGRADRQPEFTQIDLEMSFVTREDVMELVERLVKEIWKSAGKNLPDRKFKRMTLKEAMNRFGVDKPDTRFGIELQDVDDILQECEFTPFKTAIANKDSKSFDNSGVIRAINAKSLASGRFSRKDIDELKMVAKRGSKTSSIFVVEVQTDKKWKSSLTTKLTESAINQLNTRLDAKENDVLIFSAGPYSDVNATLGRLRTHTAQLLYTKGFLQKELDPSNFHHLWVIDFPMFERIEDNNDSFNDIGNGQISLSATHHPFTAPCSEDAVILDEILAGKGKKQKLLEDPEIVKKLLNISAQHYDIVCNGWELGGGSIRIHQAELQRAIFEDVLDLSTLQRQSFKHLLQALSHGAPPHGGFALGLDRLVAILCGASSLRDVIAFPKSSTGNELMTNAPGPVLPEQLKEYHIQVQHKDDNE